MSDNDFFIGWSDEMPDADKRSFLRTSVLLGGGALVGAGVLASVQKPVGSGTWNQGDIRTFTGIATSEPYAMLRTMDIDGTPQTALLACLGKCGVTARIGSYAGKPVSVRGTLIQRGRHTMIAVVDDIDWITAADIPEPNSLAFGAAKALGELTLTGTILDSKCWFGAMRPAEGKVHKSCAALCIRGGIPPALFVKDRTGRSKLLIMSDQNGRYGDEILPLVAEPVQVSGALLQRDELLFLDAEISAISRV
ncbi:MAG: hypothetical protein ABJG15_15745 [Hyphomonadaceae bacterium]